MVLETNQYAFEGKKPRRNVPVNNEVFLQVLELHPEILQQILSTVVNVIMFEECRNQWSMSRPLLGLILLNEEVSDILYILCVHNNVMPLIRIIIAIYNHSCLNIRL